MCVFELRVLASFGTQCMSMTYVYVVTVYVLIVFILYT